MKGFIFYKVFFFALEFLQKNFKGMVVFVFGWVNFTKKYFLLKEVLKKLNAKNYKKFLNANPTTLYTGRTYPYVRKITQGVLCPHFKPSSLCIPSPLIQRLQNK